MTAITLRQLRYLDALARHRHFGRAAEDCAVTQPALSNQIKELENLLAVDLVERSSRHVALTALGEEIVERARAVLASVEELADLARTAHHSLGRVLRLGLIPTVAPYLLPQITRALSAAYDGIDIRPREAMTQTLVDDLIAYRLDAAIVALPLGNSALEEAPLFEEDFVLVRHASDADKPVPTPAHLREMRLLLLEEGHCLRDQALSFCAVGGKPTRDILEGSSLSTLVQMVSAGIGLTLIPEIAVPLETRTANIAIARFADDVPKRKIGLVWRKSNPFREELFQMVPVLSPHGAEVF